MTGFEDHAATVDRLHAVPLYHQIFLQLREEITSGERAFGSRMPTEQELAASFGVSRITARRALAELAETQLVARKRRVGTTVIFQSPARPIEGSIDQAIESLLTFGRSTQVKLIELDEAPARAPVSDALGVKPGTPLIRVVRVRWLDGEPLGHLISYVPADLAGHITRAGLRTTPILALIEQAGVKIGGATQTISATLADAALAAALTVEIGAPIPPRPLPDPARPAQDARRNASRLMADWTSEASPRLTRFRMATMGAPDLAAFERCYVDWLGYRVRERGTVDAGLAASWGLAAMAGRPTLTLSSDGADDVHIRAVGTDAIAGYRPLTTFGWNACEIIVDDVHALAERLAPSPFTVLDGPHPLQFMPSIHAMQLIGPAGECLYLTMEGGDRAASILPAPRAAIDRPFILVLAGGDFEAMRRWYVDRFDLRQRPIRSAKVRVVQRAQGLDPDDAFPLTTLGLAEHGFLIEIDGYPTGPGRIAAPRATAAGLLPQGNAMASFAIDDIGRVADIAIAPPVRRDALGYDGCLACTVVGPAGELVELVDEGQLYQH